MRIANNSDELLLQGLLDLKERIAKLGEL